ncbi:hypothetical protein J4456_00515 [Candidatus Pacearchaeota archaeon]|nr:hypothetical protein [Candidatus Pacearchaeota archaeon]
MKYLIFDAGPLINFSMNGLLPMLEKLKKEFKGQFIITKEVKREIIDVPLGIKKYELEALRLQDAFNKKIIQHADLTEKEIDELRLIRDRLMQVANNTFKTKKGYLHLIDKGESAALALSILMKKKFKENIPLVVDERTTRMLVENPDNLKKYFERKFNAQINVNKKNYQEFAEFKIIRSTELAYVIWKKNLLEIKDSRALEAMVYALKFHGCSITDGEIEEMKRLVR